jgi:isoquinoline 1-oxidoreductase subunit beta
MDGNRISPTLTRRHFLVTAVTAAGGFAIGISAVPRLAHAATVAAQPWNDDNAYAPHEIDAWIAIDPDDSVLIRYQRSEMGQGSMTALPMLINEELQADWSKVRIEYASPNRNIREKKVYGDMYSHGSQSVRASQKKVQQVGASARERLIAAAAARWNVPAGECGAANSVITHTPTGRTLRYGEVAPDAAKIALNKEPDIKTPDKFTFAGKPMPRVDVAHKIDGSAKFGMDVQVPGMVFAAIQQCPVPGGKLKSVDESPVQGAPGVMRVVKLDDAVAVVATGTFWRAKQALAKLQPEWDVGAAGGVDSASLSKDFHAALDGPALTARSNGDVAKAMGGGAKTIEAVYETPYLSHSPMEPMNATAHLQRDRLDIWVGTQDALEATEAAAKAAGLEPEQVYVHNVYLGGGFGRRDANDEVKHAIVVAKAVERPLKLIWTREEDTRRDKFRPHAVVRFKAGVGSDGMPTALSARVVTSSIFASAGRKFPPNRVEPMATAGISDIGYAIPNFHVDAVIKNTHMPVWFWRAPGANQHVYAMESFIDELATAAGQDPYQFRRKLLEGKPDWRLGQALAQGPRPRHRDLRGHRQPLRASRRGHSQADRRGQGRPRHRRARHALHGQSPNHCRAGGRIRHFRPDSRALRQDRGEERHPRAGQFRYLPHGASGRGAEDRGLSGPERRPQMGRRRRARDAADRRRGCQRDLCCDRQAHPHLAHHR